MNFEASSRNFSFSFFEAQYLSIKSMSDGGGGDNVKVAVRVCLLDAYIHLLFPFN
jgi:hypothetical protein